MRRGDEKGMLTSVHKCILVISIVGSFLIQPDNRLHADDSFVVDNGSVVYPINTDKVSMVSERVSVMLNKFGEKDVEVECEFIFENTTSEEIRAKVGFPSRKGHNPFGVLGNSPLGDFVTYIDGVEVPVEMKEGDADDSSAESSRFNKGEERFWYIWDVTFPPDRKIKIVNRYKTKYSDASLGPSFNYILTTGANWKGPIGHAVIEVTMVEDVNLRDRCIYAFPPGFEIKGNKLVWEISNFEPTQDINVGEGFYKYCSIQQRISHYLSQYYFPSKDYEGNKRFYDDSDMSIRGNDDLFGAIMAERRAFTPEDYMVDEADKLYLDALRNEIYARNGKMFESDELEKFFRYNRWYKADPDFSEAVLNDFEKENIEFISDYMKKKGWELKYNN